MTLSERAILVRWMQTEFRHACQHDQKRLEESICMLKVGRDQGDEANECMSRAIASFVVGLIEGSQPITVPTENN